MSDLELIKSKLNLVDVVREYVPNLKKTGRNWSSLSPFRNERTPSFMVNEELGIWKDFGGDKAGDVITFVMEMENVDFRRALEICAQKAGVTLTSSYKKDSKLEQLKEKILQINSISAETFHFIALKHKLGQSAREYIAKRGFSNEILEKYKIGYAPRNLQLEKILKAKLNIDVNDKTLLLTSGLFVEKNSLLKDKFQDRLMFPIRNLQGSIVGFSGRVLIKTDERPKYINSPETPVYKKSELLFNLYEAKQSIKKNDFIILTEGQIDCIISTQAKVENIVAPLGTSLTIEQLKVIKRYTENICLCFNNDAAGLKAIERAFIISSQLNLNCKVIELPEEVNGIKIKDIDELIKVDKNKWQEISKIHVPFIDYLSQRLLREYNLKVPQERKTFVNKILQYISQIKDGVEAQAYIQKLSILSETDEETLRTSLKNVSTPNVSRTYYQQDQNQETLSPKKSIPTSYTQRCFYLIAHFFTYPNYLKDIKLKDDFFEDNNLNILISLAVKYLEKNNKLTGNEFYKHAVKINPELTEILEQIYLYDIAENKESLRDMNLLYKELEKEYKKRKIGEIRMKIVKQEVVNSDTGELTKEVVKYLES